MEKNIDELKKKVLELCDTIDKQNDLIVKYQRALSIAGYDIVNTERYRNRLQDKRIGL